MNTIKATILSFLLLFSLISCLETVTSTTAPCQTAACDAYYTEHPKIRFPFRIDTRQPETCGHPGFDVTCDLLDRARLQLPSGEFTVQRIDYAKQDIWLNDPEYCLPRRLLSLNLTGSLFCPWRTQDLTLFDCPQSWDYQEHHSDLSPIYCMSDLYSNVFAILHSAKEIRVLSKHCSDMGTFRVPVKRKFHHNDQWLLSLGFESDYLRLRWDQPRCGRCVKRGGTCGFKSNSTDVVCSNISRGRDIAVGVAVPAILFVLVLLWCMCCRTKTSTGESTPLPVVAPQQQPAIVKGLDLETLAACPKIVLGESLRLMKPDDITCSICLSDYLPNETLKTLPECQHCFHANCIDDWLKLNATCPICRDSISTIYVGH